jgi:DNA-directed RNA polymerase subunit alpha
VKNSQLWVKFERLENNGGRFVLSPLKRGMGVTIGNSIRRVLLSSLEGAAAVSVIIEGVEHEFSTLPNVMEDVIDIVCNLKGIVFKYELDAPKVLRLEYKGKGIVKARDIKCDAEIEILNGDQHIAELTSKDAKFNMELVIEKGVGYVPSEANRKDGQDIRTINMNASFSPIVRVNHKVEKIRVGKELDYDSLILEIWSNGSILPEVAVKKATNILVEQFSLFSELNKKPQIEEAVVEEESEKKKQQKALTLKIDDLELSARSSNCLKKAGISTVADLVSKNLEELSEIKNFGKKSADEINSKLKQYSLELKFGEQTQLEEIGASK